MKAKDIIKRVRRELVETSGAFWSDEELLDLINRAENAYSTEIKLYEDVAYLDTVPGVSSYVLPKNFISAYGVYINNRGTDNKDKWQKLASTTLDKVSQEMYNFLSKSTEDLKVPTRYFIWGNEINLLPTPDKKYQIFMYYKASPRKLESVEDELNTPDLLADAIETFVLWKAWKKEKELDLANNAKQEYLEWVLKGRKWIKKRQADAKIKIDIESHNRFTF